MTYSKNETIVPGKIDWRIENEGILIHFVYEGKDFTIRFTGYDKCHLEDSPGPGMEVIHKLDSEETIMNSMIMVKAVVGSIHVRADFGFTLKDITQLASYGFHFDNMPITSPPTMIDKVKLVSLGMDLPSSKDKRVDDLPGVNAVVKNPTTGDHETLMEVIIDLNDDEEWTREQIADWLESLDVDLEFK